MDDERTEEQDEASDDVEPSPDAGVPGHDRPEDPAPADADGERARTPSAGL